MRNSPSEAVLIGIFLVIFIGLVVLPAYYFVVRRVQLGSKRFFRPVHRKERLSDDAAKQHVLRHNLSQQFTISKWRADAVNLHDSYYLELLYLYTKKELKHLDKPMAITLHIEHDHSDKTLDIMLEPMSPRSIFTYFGSRRFSYMKFFFFGLTFATKDPKIIGRCALSQQQVELISLANRITITSKELPLVARNQKMLEAANGGVWLDDNYFRSFKFHIPQLLR